MKMLAILCVGNLATVNPALSVEWSAFTLLATAVGVMAWFVADAVGV